MPVGMIGPPRRDCSGRVRGAPAVAAMDLPTSRNSTKFTTLFAALGCTIKHPNACGSTIRVWFGFLGMLLITALTAAGNVVFHFP